MQFKVQKGVLAKALGTVGRSVAAKATLPALGGVLMEVVDEELILAGSNLETSIRVKTPVKVESEGLFLTGARLFTDFILSLPESEITITTHEIVMSVTCGKTKSTFAGMAVDEYPELGFDGHQTPHVLDGDVLAQAIEHVHMAASNDDARAILTGLHVQISGGVFELAATDGFRLAVEKVVVEKGEEFSVVLPAKVMVELARLIKEAEQGRGGKIKCGRTVEGTQMVFVLPSGVQMISRLLEGTFPPYQKIIPTSYATKVRFESEELAAEVKRAALFSSGGSQLLKIDFSKQEGGQGKAIFVSGGNQVGEYSGEVEVVLEGSDNRIGFNAKYLLEFLSRIKAKEVVLEMNRAETPGLWRAVGLEELIYVVMPMNL